MRYLPSQTPPLKLSSCLILLACAALLTLASDVKAQNEVTGAFEGEVRESIPNGLYQPLPDVEVKFINVNTGVTASDTTDKAGRFYKGLLPPGDYKIEIETRDPDLILLEAPSLQKLFVMRPYSVIPVPITLIRRSATATAQPTPVASAPADTERGDERKTSAEINRTDARRGGIFDEKEVSTLPLGAITLTRSFDELALFLPGVALPPQTQGSISGPGVGQGVGSSGQFSINGIRSRANNFTVDGSDNNDEDIGVRRQGFFSLVPQPVETVQEYQVISLLAPAQYGRNIGGQVNAVSKRGTSGTHGAIFGLINSSQLNAREFFDSANGNGITPLTSGPRFNLPVILNFFQQAPGGVRFPLNVQNQSGGKDALTLGQGGFVLGGPLDEAQGLDKPHHWFYFFSAEGQVLNASKEVNFNVPTLEQRGLFGTGATGFTQDPFTGRTFTQFGSTNLLDIYPLNSNGNAVFSLFPFPNNPQGVYGANTFTQSLPASAQGRILSGRFDGDFSLGGKQQSVAARYNFTQDWRDIPAAGGAIFATIRPRIRTQNFSTYLNSEVSNAVLNQLRLSYGRTRLNFEDVRDPAVGRGGPFGVPNSSILSSLQTGQLLRPLRPLREFIPNAPNDRPPFLTTLPQFVLSGNLIETSASPLNNTACAGRPAPCAVLFSTSNPFGTTRDNYSPTTGQDAIPGLGAIGQVIIGGFSPLGVDVFNFPQRRVNNTYQLADMLTYRTGRHQFAFGADVRRSELNSELPRNSRPLVTFFGGLARLPQGQLFLQSGTRVNDVTAVTPPGTALPNGQRLSFINPIDLAAAAAPTGLFQTINRTDTYINLRYYQLNFFAQDDYRINSHLSLSYGLRYEYNTPARELNRRIENTFNASELALLPGFRNFIDGRTSIYEPDRTDFAPRVGVAYARRLFGEQETIFRAGFGLYYDQILGAVVSQSRNVFPNTLTLNFAGSCGFGSQLRRCEGLRTEGDFPNGSLPFSTLNPNQYQLGGGGLPLVSSGTINTLNPDINLATLINNIQTAFPSPFGLTLPARRLKMPMAEHYSFTVEQPLGPDTVVSVAYVGTQGHRLLRFTTPNLGPNIISIAEAFRPCVSFNSATNICNNPREPFLFGQTYAPGVSLNSNGTFADNGRPVPGVGAVNIFETSANSNYHSLQLQARGRLLRSVQYQAAYTFSRAIDDVSDVFDLAGASSLPQNSFDLGQERGLANFDVRHRFTYNFVLDLPAFNNLGALGHGLFGGWQLASTGQMQTGQPFTVNSLFDVNLDGNLTDRPNTTNGITVTGDRRQPLRLTVEPTSLLAPIGQNGAVGRNTFRAGGILLLNLAAVKNFPVTEKQTLIFRAEVFNLTNRANFGIPIRFLEADHFGEATDTVTPGRRIQFVLKYQF